MTEISLYDARSACDSCRLEARGVAAADSAREGDDTTVRMLSISKLLQLVSIASAGESSELLSSWSIQHIELLPPEEQENASLAVELSRLKRSRGNDDNNNSSSNGGSRRTSAHTQDAGIARQVAYTSDSVWLTGFLRFRDAEKNLAAECELRLCDTSSLGCHALVLDPRPEYVDQLVLVKKWMLVDTGALDSTTSRGVSFGNLFLEVHEPPTILPCENEPQLQVQPPSQEEVIRLLDAKYPKQDPPMYVGSNPWRAVCGESGAVASEQPAQLSRAAVTKAKATKRKVYAIFGRVMCVSPVANAQDRSRCHFFGEVEFQNHEQNQQHLVIIMFTGATNVKWRLFLRPGYQVLVTDLVKVYSRECGIVLLQTTTADNKAKADEPTALQLETQVFVWQQEEEMTLLREIGGRQFAESRQERETLNSEGVIKRVLWNDCLEVQSGDDESSSSFVVCLFHFPSVDLSKVRAGATVRIHNAHVLRRPNPIDYRIVVGLCARSHFSVIAHSSAPHQCLRPPMPTNSRHKDQSKTLSYMGDRRTQPLSVSVWLFEVVEALKKKFAFGSSAALSINLHKALTAFPHIRRREALSIVAEALKVEVGESSNSLKGQKSTLSGQFLNSHAPDARNCSSVRIRERVPRGQMVRIRDLEDWGRARLTQAYAEELEQTASKKSSGGRFAIQVPAEDLDWCLLVGCLNGNVYSGDLEICDRTGSLPFSIRRGSKKMSWGCENSRHLYVIRRFELIAEAYCSPGVARDFEKDVVIFRISCSADAVERISMEDARVSAPRGEQELIVFVTHVDPVKRPSALSDKLRWLRPVYRHMHGIALPAHVPSEEKSLEMPRRVEILINANIPHWHVEKYVCYKITGAICEENPLSVASDRPTASAATVEEKAILLTDLFLSTAPLNDSIAQPGCFEGLVASVNDFDAPYQNTCCSRLKIYRMEAGCGIEPLKFEAGLSNMFTCANHKSCARLPVTQQGLLHFSRFSQIPDIPGLYQARLLNELLPLERSAFEISPQQLLLLSLLQHFALRAENVIQVTNLLRHPLPNVNQLQREEVAGSDIIQTGILSGGRGLANDIHRTKLYSIVGVIAEKKLYWVQSEHSPVETLGTASVSRGSPVNTKKREHENGLSIEAVDTQRNGNRELMCLYKVRDFQSLNTIKVYVNASRFGVQADLQPRAIVEFSKLQGFVARSTYKVSLNWGNCSGARELQDSSSTFKVEAPRDAELYGAMKTSRLNELYHAQVADRTLRRWVVRVVYVNNVFLKRRCRTCYGALVLELRRVSWVHQIATPSFNNKKPSKCSWHQVQTKDPQFEALTYASLSMRCVIDDGSAQAELYLENDVAWDLLACSAGARRRFEEIVRSQLAELSYFTGQSSAAPATVIPVAPLPAFKGDEDCQNEFRSMILSATQSLRSVMVFGQRFYSLNRVNKNDSSNGNDAGESERVLTFGKDIQITTKSTGYVKLEACRVDPLLVHVKSELRQRLASLRYQLAL